MNTALKIHELDLPTKEGLYVVSGTLSLVHDVMDRLVDFLAQENKKGADINYGRLFWIDSGNSFDAYHLSKKARQQGLEPRRVLRAIQLARPFTAFQYQQMLDQIPRPVYFQGRKLLPVVIVSDLMGLFYDEEIQELDLKRAYREFSWRLSYLKQRAIILALNIQHNVPLHRQHLLPEVAGHGTNLAYTNPAFA